MAITLPFDGEPGDHACCTRHERVEYGLGGDTVGRKGRTAIEAEPPEPEDAGTEHDEGQVVGWHGLVGPAGTLAEDHDEGERRNTGIDVNRRAAGEVDGGGVELAVVPADIDPVEDRGVDDEAPDRHKDRPGGELHTVGDRTAISAGVIASERHREGDRDECIRALHVLEAEGVEVADERLETVTITVVTQ